MSISAEEPSDDIESEEDNSIQSQIKFNQFKIRIISEEPDFGGHSNKSGKSNDPLHLFVVCCKQNARFHHAPLLPTREFFAPWRLFEKKSGAKRKQNTRDRKHEWQSERNVG